MAAENTVQPKTSGLAVASLILGIAGLVVCIIGPVLAGIPALILGIVALSKIGGSEGKLGGKGLAIAGIVTGGLSLASIPVAAGLFIPAFARARGMARRTQCHSNLKQIGLACHMYSQDNNDVFPEKLSQLYPNYVMDLELFRCSTAGGVMLTEANVDEELSYVLIPGRKASERADSVLVYDKKDNHFGDGANVLFIDGHVEWIDLAALERLLSAPPLGP